MDQIYAPVIVFLSIGVGMVINLSIEIDTECEKFGTCRSIPDYPHDLARELIKKLKDKGVMFPNERLLNPPQTTLQPRFGGDFDDFYDTNKYEPVCVSEETYISPFKAKDIYDNERFILNDRKDPVQTFRYEICKSKTCSSHLSFLPNYGAECVQKYTHQEMYYIENNSYYTEYFPVPCCCSCSIISVP